MLRPVWSRLAPMVARRQALQPGSGKFNCVQPLRCGWYHGTTVWYKGDNDDGDDREPIVVPGQPVIQTLNADHLSPEEVDRILEEEEAAMQQDEDEKFVKNWKPGMRRRPLKTSYDLQSFEYELEPDKHEALWNSNLDKRCGALAIKAGMMPVYDDWGIRHPCTVLMLDRNLVMSHKTMERDGYMSVLVAAGQRKRKNVGLSILGQYKELQLANDEDPPYMMREFRITDPGYFIPVGQQIHASHFCAGQAVDVSAISKGKGFQGAMKRHGFKGLPASHGVSRSHRALGSTGSNQDPGKVFKGKKMAGRMGGTRVTKQNLRVLQVDRGRNLVYVVGAVPGPRGRFVEIRDAVKKPGWNTDKVREKRPPVPTVVPDAAIDGTGVAGHVVFMPLPPRDPLASDMDDEKA